METWKDIWFYVFFIASGMFYLIVVTVAAKGFADVKEMFTSLLSMKRDE